MSFMITVITDERTRYLTQLALPSRNENGTNSARSGSDSHALFIRQFNIEIQTLMDSTGKHSNSTSVVALKGGRLNLEIKNAKFMIVVCHELYCPQS